ncbi:hypothetical protein BGZ95_011138 [Linnemannia exigua]|uniref:Amine oxidase domain-containing protein n=1 Tax=Linnemannia exigua TaxID=604196 RepID=A0AAD4DC51_9FUNG|nr:hypothetical protein BGZ95_011138 [Linnemannia exigua]
MPVPVPTKRKATTTIRPTQRVIIIGGGISGLGAARELSKDPTIQVTLLEARSRLGGRIVTHRDLVPKSLELSGKIPPGASDIPYDFGASWIHGVNPDNPLFEIAQLGQLEYIHTDSDVMFMQPGPDAMPKEESDQLWQVIWSLWYRAQSYATEHRDEIAEDKSFIEWLKEYLDGTQSHDPEGENYMEEKVKKWIPGMALHWADENAIPLENMSLKYMDAERIFPGPHSLVINGYDRVIKVVSSGLKKNVKVLLEHVVEKIEYDESEVRVSTSQGLFTADKLICTLPLGVLQHQHSTLFSPPLPTHKQKAISRLRFGTMYKILLFFPTCFWPPQRHFINFLPSALSIPSPDLVSYFKLNEKQVEALTVHMQDLSNSSSLMPQYNIPIIIGYAVNGAAELMERLTDEEARMVFLCQMAHYFPILVQEAGTGKEGELVGKALWPTVSFMTRWSQDPFARGSYTSIPLRASQADLETFSIPVGVQSYGITPLCGNDSDEEKYRTKKRRRTTRKQQQPEKRLKAVDDNENGRIFFAGEHTSPSRFASVHGALMTGQREAARILGQECSL